MRARAFLFVYRTNEDRGTREGQSQYKLVFAKLLLDNEMGVYVCVDTFLKIESGLNYLFFAYIFMHWNKCFQSFKKGLGIN